MIKIVNLQKSSHRVKLVSDSKRENESESDKEKMPSPKRKIDEPLDQEEFATWRSSEFNTKNINTGEDKLSTNRVE